jgi:hypothetical protein
MKCKALYIAFLMVLCAGESFAQSATGAGTIKTSDPKDTAIIFGSPRPLFEDNTASAALNNSIGFAGLINDYGFGLGFYYRRNISPDLSALLSLDIGTAKGSKEFNLFGDEIVINRIYVLPIMASVQYRFLREALGEGLRPYLTAGAGPVIIGTTDASKEFFTALVNPTVTSTFGGFFGFGAYFGSDPKTSFGASLKYYIIPYHSPGVESSQGVFLTDFSGAALTVTYGFNF